MRYGIYIKHVKPVVGLLEKALYGEIAYFSVRWKARRVVYRANRICQLGCISK